MSKKKHKKKHKKKLKHYRLSKKHSKKIKKKMAKLDAKLPSMVHLNTLAGLTLWYYMKETMNKDLFNSKVVGE